MQRRARLIFVIVAVLAGAALALVLLARSLLAPERFTALLTRAVADAGLELNLAGPAQPALWPRPAVELDGLQLLLPGGEGELLAARSLRLVVPWRTVFGGETRITKLELDAPRLDIEPLRAWLAMRPQQRGAPTLPGIEAGVHVHDGQVRNGPGTLLLDHVELETGALHAGQAFDLGLRGVDARGRPLSLDLHTRPLGGPGIRLDLLDLKLLVGEQDRIDVQGRLSWQGGDSLGGNLAGKLRAAGQDYALKLDLDSLEAMTLALDNGASRAVLSLSPQRAWAWWQDFEAGTSTGIALPPVQGNLDVQQVDVAGWNIEGLRIESGVAAAGSAAPAAAATVPAGSVK